MTQEEAIQRLNVETDLIPPGASNRPGTQIRPTYVTIHNTANPSPGADARMHARYLKGEDARARKVSWHFTVDDVRCVKHLPTSEKGWHAKSGNATSIGIEICEHDGIDQAAAIERGALLAAVLMLEHGIPPERVVPHQHWTKKECPRVILRQPGGFEEFRERVAELLAELRDASPEESARSFMKGVSFTLSEPIGAVSETTSGRQEDFERLERLVGRLLAENQRLNEALDDVIEVE